MSDQYNSQGGGEEWWNSVLADNNKEWGLTFNAAI
jgi:hypothetical protein